MKNVIEKEKVLERLKAAYNIKKNTELAAFLGISKPTLSNWGSRNSIDYDLVFSKCENINLDWLLTGRGSMFRDDGSVRTREESIDTESSLVYKVYKEKDDENKTLIKQNAVLEERIRQLEADNESLRSQSGADRITDTFTDLPLVDYEEDYPPVERPSSSKHPLAGKA